MLVLFLLHGLNIQTRALSEILTRKTFLPHHFRLPTWEPARQRLQATRWCIVVPPLRYPSRNIVASFSISFSRAWEVGSMFFSLGVNWSVRKMIPFEAKDYKIFTVMSKYCTKQGRKFKKKGSKFQWGQPAIHSNCSIFRFRPFNVKFKGNGRNMMASLLRRPPVEDRVRLSPIQRASKSVSSIW